MALHHPVHVLDNYYLAITLLVTVAYQLIGFSLAYTFKFDKLTDFMGGTNFIWLAILTLSMSGTTDARQIVTSIFIMLWAGRLSGFLLFRILKTGKDDRFDGMRQKFFSFLGFWVFQMLWVWTVRKCCSMDSQNLEKQRISLVSSSTQSRSLSRP